jgi:hypothetical protein
LVLIFWLQRGYSNPLSSYFPDSILVALAVLGAMLIVRGTIWADRSANYPEVPDLRRLITAVGLLLAWVFLISPLGYLIGSILMFLAMSLFLRGRPVRVKNVAMDAAVSVVVVSSLYYFFTQMLFVSLPPIPFM